MAKGRDGKLGAAVLTTVGLLWLTLTGLCTWSFAKDSGPYGGAWPIGLWFMSIGVLPLALGLRSFLPERVLGGALSLAGAAWLAYGVQWLVAGLTQSGGSSSGGDLPVIIVLWLVFQAPGAWMLGAGLRMLRARPTAPSSGSDPPPA